MNFQTTENVNTYEIDLLGQRAAVAVKTTITTPSKVSLNYIKEYVSKHAVRAYPDDDNLKDQLEFDGEDIGLGVFNSDSIDNIVEEIHDYLITELGVQVL